MIELVKYYNSVQSGVTSTLLLNSAPDARAQKIVKFLLVVSALNTGKDFHSAHAVMTGIQEKSVLADSQTWEKLSAQELRMFRKFSDPEIFNGETPNIPFLGTIMKKISEIFDYESDPCFWNSIPMIPIHILQQLTENLKKMRISSGSKK